MAKRMISTELWEDMIWRNEITNIETRYLWLYLLTNKNTNISGIYHLPLDIVALDTKLSLNALKSALNELVDKKLCDYSWKTEEIVIYNYPRYNINKLISPIADSISRHLHFVKDKSLIDKMYYSLSKYEDDATRQITKLYRPYLQEKKLDKKEYNSKNNSNSNINSNNNTNSKSNSNNDISNNEEEEDKKLF